MSTALRTALGAALTVLLGPVSAAPAAPPAADFSLGLSERQPVASTAMTLHVLYRDPQNPAGKPPPIRSVVIDAPDGLRIDGGALPRCAATDDQLRVLGRNACPGASTVGTGTLTAITGAGPPVDPVAGDVTVFNGGDQLIELVSLRGTNTTAGIDRFKIQGSRLTASPPATPGGPPDGQTAVREINLTIAAAGAAARPFITTPPTCPAAGSWRSRGAFGFAGGASAAITSTTACQGAPRRARAPRLALRLKTRRRSRDARKRSCASGRVRATVAGRDRALVRRARFRLGRRAVRRPLDARRPFTRIVYRPRKRASRRHTVRASVRLHDGRLVRLKKRFRACR